MFKEQICDEILENTYQTRLYKLKSVKVKEKMVIVLKLL